MERGTVVACGGRLSTQWRFYLGQWRQVKIAGTRSGGHHHVPAARLAFLFVLLLGCELSGCD